MGRIVDTCGSFVDSSKFGIHTSNGTRLKLLLGILFESVMSSLSFFNGKLRARNGTSMVLPTKSIKLLDSYACKCFIYTYVRYCLDGLLRLFE